MPTSTHFRSGGEQLDACVALVCARLSAAFLSAMEEEGGDLRGISLRTGDVERILTPRDEAVPVGFADIRQAEAGFRARSKRSRLLGVRLPLDELCEAFRLTAFQRFALHLAVAMERMQELERVVAYLQEDMNARAPTLGLALRLFAITGETGDADIFGQRDFFRLLFLPEGQEARPIARPLRLHPRVMEYLSAPDAPPDCLRGFAVCHPAGGRAEPVRFCEPIVDDLADTVSGGDGERRLLGLLCGDAGSGKRLILRHVAARAGRGLLVADADALPDDAARATPFAIDLLRECRLRGAMIALRCARPPEGERLEELKRLLSVLEEGDGPLWLLCDADWPQAAALAGDRWDFIRRTIPQLTAAQRTEWWRSMPGIEDFQVDLELLSNKYAFSPGMMGRAFRDARRIAKWHDMRGSGGDHIFALACRQQLANSMGEHATLLQSPFVWDDLVLPQDRREQLEAICAQVHNHHTVFDDWGFSRRVPYGRSLSALFTGPPGTGKTMAAQVVANALGIELYKINLSAVVSKYVGETEKNLELVFTEGARSQCILLFDEADALFAKRTDLKDSGDRYANTESAYLLQRIEDYQGIVIMTTNYPQNFDPAFRRRIKYTVDFPMPDAEARLLMWRKILAPPAPLDERLDLGHLAERFELTGSSIKNIAMNAAFAAAQARAPIGRDHIQQAVRVEYAKSGRMVDTGF